MKDSAELLNIAICEDVSEDALRLKSYIEQFSMPTACHCFESGESLLCDFRPNRYDLIFLDIYMNGIQGVDTAKIIREKDRNVMIAFTTASVEHTLESYRLGALKYLEKPVTAPSVKETLEIALKMRSRRPCISITIAGGRPVEVFLDCIQYFEQKGHVIEVHTTSGILNTSQSVKMKSLEEKLPLPPFLRCHRSFIVNLGYVQQVNRRLNAFLMENGGRADIRRGSAALYEQALDQWRLEEAGRIEL